MRFKPSVAFLKKRTTTVLNKINNVQYRGPYGSSSKPRIECSAELSDGSVVYGGTFIGFVDSSGVDYSCGNIIKLLPNGTVDTTFQTNIGTGFNSTVNSIATDGTNIYVGGQFTSFNGVTNNARYIAKLSTSGVFDTAFSNSLDVVSGTKATTSGFNNSVRAIATDGTSIYVGGSFSSFKGTATNGIAKLSTSGVRDATFASNIGSGTSSVWCITVTGTNIYIGGQFTSFNGVTNNARYIAKLSTSGVFDTAFSDNLDVTPAVKASTSGFSGQVFSITTDGTNIYVGGQFTSFKGSSLNNARYIAKLSTSGVFDTAFSNNLDVTPGTKASTSGFDNSVYTIATDGTNIYVGGIFSSFKGTSNNNSRNIAKLSTSGVFDTAFSNNLDVVSGTKASTSGFATGGLVYSIVVSGTNLYIGGSFFSFKNTSRINLAKLNTSGVSQSYTQSYYISSNSIVSTSVIDNSGNIYFTTNNAIVNGTSVGYISKLLPNGLLDTTFQTNIGTGFNDSVYTIATDGTNIYVGGNFTSFNGVANNARYIAKLSASGVLDTAFSNNLDVTPGTKASTSGFNSNVRAIATDGTNIYVSGSFTSFKNITNNANGIAKLSTSGVFDQAFSNNLDVTPAVKASTSGFNSYANSIIVSGTNLYMGGQFTSFKGIANNANRIAKLSTSGVFDTAFSDNLDVVSGTKASTSGFDNTVNSIATDGTNIYVGGSFKSFKNIANNANGIAKLSTSGVFDTAFSNSLDVVSGTKATTSGFGFSAVNSVVAVGSSIYVGGPFTSFKDISANAISIAKLSTSGVFDQIFSNGTDAIFGTKTGTSGLSGTVYSLSYSQSYGSLVVTGQFDYFKGTVPCFGIYVF